MKEVTVHILLDCFYCQYPCTKVSTGAKTRLVSLVMSVNSKYYRLPPLLIMHIIEVTLIGHQVPLLLCDIHALHYSRADPVSRNTCTCTCIEINDNIAISHTIEPGISPNLLYIYDPLFSTKLRSDEPDRYG